MATLAHDESGFLVGTPVQGNQKDRLGEISSDVKAIRGYLMGSAGAVKSTVRQAVASAVAQARTSAPGGTRRSSSSSAGTAAITSAAPVRSSRAPSTTVAALAADTATTKASARPRRTGETEVQSNGRNALGQFVAGSRGASGESDSKVAYAAGKVADALGTLSDIATPGESIDPFMQMVGEVSTPLKAITGTFRTAVGGVFGGKEERFYTRWYRRMFGEARLFRKQNAEAMKDANKTLSDIEDEQAQGSGSGGKGGFFGMSLGGIARPLAALLRPARGLMKLLKKVPVIGGVIGGIAGIADWLSVENDDNLSRRDKDKAHGKNVGGIAGMFSGAAAGAAAGTLLGPVGTVIGGIVGAFLGDKAGQILGDIVGGWVNDLREYDIPGKITAAWASVVEKWTAVTEAVSSAWDRVTGAFDETLGAIRSALKDWFDIDLPSMDSVKETVWGSVSEGVDYIKSTAVGQGLSVVSDTFDYWFGDSSASNTPATPMIPAVTNVTRQAPAAPKSATVRPGAPAAPSTIKALTSDANRPKISVSVTAPDAGQDVRDRGIAHIASGGIAE